MSLNIEQINYNDFKNICRTCMCNCDIKFIQDCVISDVFFKLTNMHFETNDELPQQICGNCFEKINEIHAFALKCNETYSSLIKCLNNYKILRFDQEIDSTDIQIKNEFIKEEDITIEEHKIEFVPIEELNSTNDNINDERKLNQNFIENIKSEFNNEQNINFSPDDLLISNTATHSFVDDHPYKCDQSFSKMANLKCHLHLHSGERSHKCEQCSSSFDNICDLKLHMRTHTGKQSYKCIQCSKSFTRLSHLTIHMRTHSGERPYKCKHCSKSFISSSDMNSHMRTHSGERTYKCNQCSKSFYWSSHLIVHMRTHSGERPYKCKHCLKSFTQSNHLKQHIRTHSSPKCDT